MYGTTARESHRAAREQRPVGQLVMWSPDRTRQPGSNQRATARSAHARRTQEDAYAVDFIILEIVDDTRALEEAWRNCCPLTSASAPAQDVNAASASWWQCDFSHEDARCLSQLDVLQAKQTMWLTNLGAQIQAQCGFELP